MIELGQYVRVDKIPSYGAEYFYSGDITIQDWVTGIYLRDGRYVYELYDQDEDCLWTEDEVTVRGDYEEVAEPAFWFGDEVYVNGDIEDTRTITAVAGDTEDILYKCGEDIWRYERELTLFRKKDDIHPEYTLF